MLETIGLIGAAAVVLATGRTELGVLVLTFGVVVECVLHRAI